MLPPLPTSECSSLPALAHDSMLPLAFAIRCLLLSGSTLHIRTAELVACLRNLAMIQTPPSFLIPTGKLPTPALHSSLKTASGSPPRSSLASALLSSSAQVVSLRVDGRSSPQITRALAHIASPILLPQSESASDLAPRLVRDIPTFPAKTISGTSPRSPIPLQ